ncbi:MAG: hypothetical protein EOL88_13925 [Bacteroidia bacterium]|nr:hypothetical protein [Bacteroidales bacterium]MDD3962707.1 hypothetical protein [Bacteroidales bacterium]MDY0286351.1 hypothetical protein [Bacteroidales bacterium]NCD43168.1 hypothetical protein [Bacteroidia bacterium]
MKKIVLLLTVAITLAFSSPAFSQANDSEVITLKATMASTLVLNLESTPVAFDFYTISDYQNGMGADKSSGMNATSGNIVSTTNWALAVVAQSQMIHNDGISVLPMDNIGLTVDFTGYNKVKNYAKNHPLALSNSETTIIGQQGNQSNAGNEEANSFTIYWEMGTRQGNMRNESLMEQDLKKGNYNMDVAFVVSEVF